MSDEHKTPVDRRYVCEDCAGTVRARWGQWGDGYPGYFSVGCECTTVPVVPEMSQAETPDNWRVERPECCRGVDVKEMETYHRGVSDYRCPECSATYRWDGTMSTAPENQGEKMGDEQQLLTDGGSAQDDSGTYRVRIWHGREYDGEPDEVVEVDESTVHIWQEDPHFHAALGIDIHPDDGPATLNVYTSDSVHSPPGYEGHVERGYWDGPMEQGLPYPEDHDYPPFGCEIWDRVMFYVEEGNTRD